MISFLKIFLYSLSLLKNETQINKIDYINDMNNQNLSYKLDIYNFEYLSNGGKFVARAECHNCFSDYNDYVPESIDWRENDAVTVVKNQGDCGSCWSFSTTGSIEGAWAVKYNKLYNLSEQMLIDCSGTYGNKGCEGGLMDYGFKYVIDNGLCSENDYPYKAERDFCHSSLCKIKVKVRDYSDIESNNELLLKKAVSKQPISVAIQANLSSFHFYKSGIYQDDDCGDQLDHGVLIVGYGHDLFHGLDYWIVKNSWSPQWGENGYVRILRNYDKSDSGMCGIAVQPSFPIV